MSNTTFVLTHTKPPLLRRRSKYDMLLECVQLYHKLNFRDIRTFFLIFKHTHDIILQ